jgi:Spy/CpxP family protein refolding chaperone
MTRSTNRLPILAASIVSGALVLGAAGAVAAHGGAGDTMTPGAMGGGHMTSGRGMAGGHGMMNGSGMMGGLDIDDEAMADLRAQMADLHQQMVELHLQAQPNQDSPEAPETMPMDDTGSTPPEAG